jgi:hypothetical protein
MIGGIIVLAVLFFMAIALTLLTLVGVNNWRWEELAFITGFFAVGFAVALIVMLICVPFCRNGDRRDIKKFEAFAATVDSARKVADSDFERWKLTQKIADWNMWVAEVQYDNHNYWGLWTAPEVDDLKPIE